MKKSPKETRRDFLKKIGVSAAALWGGSLFSPSLSSCSDEASHRRKSRVVVARDERLVLQDGKLPQEPATQLVHKAVSVLTDGRTPEAAWKRLFSAKDIVGIKVNSLSGARAGTRPEVVKGIVQGLQMAGVKEIYIWDRSEMELRRAGFPPGRWNGARIMATDTSGLGYERDIEFAGEVGSCFSRIISRLVTAIVNVPVLKDHDLAGVTLGMKNFFGAIHNPNKYHGDNCNPFIADLMTHRFIKDKLRLTICDGTMAICSGGPAYPGHHPQWAWNYGGVLASADPVALDAVGWRIIENKRKELGLPTLAQAGREPKYIATAADYNLGVMEESKIEMVEIQN
jgi:uncharacterized protein (DUF362 family)